jgi:hypothetical protein
MIFSKQQIAHRAKEIKKLNTFMGTNFSLVPTKEEWGKLLDFLYSDEFKIKLEGKK